MSDIFADTLTAQQIFDHVVVQLALQGKSSMIGASCAYRGYDGAKCGVGFLLTDEEAALGNLISVCALDRVGCLPERLVPHMDLLTHIQDVHDRSSCATNFKRNVADMLEDVAHCHGLEKGVLYAAFLDPAAPEQKSAPDAETRKIVAALEVILTDWVKDQTAALEPFPEGSSA